MTNLTLYDIGTQVAYLSVAKGLLNPFSLFAVSFLVGRKIDVKAQLSSIIISIYLGCLVAYFVGYGSGFNIMWYLSDPAQPLPWAINVISGVIPSILSSLNMFFVSFSGLAIASITKRQIKTTDQ